MAVLLALAALLLAVEPAEPQIYSYDSIRQVPAPELAERLLGAELAADIVQIEVEPLGLVEQLGSVRLVHRPQPLEADGCTRRVDSVFFYPVASVDAQTPPRQVRTRPESRLRGLEVALAPACRLDAGQRFAALSRGIGAHDGAATLRRLNMARRAAAASGDLPFRFSCEDTTGQRACGGDGRAALAGLPVEQTRLIVLPRAPVGALQAIVGEPGQLYWEVTMTGSETDLTDLVMTRRVPAPF